MFGKFQHSCLVAKSIEIEAQREHILEKYLSEVTDKKLNLSSLVKKTEGLSGAYLREIIITACMISLENKVNINQEILEEATNDVLELKENA